MGAEPRWDRAVALLSWPEFLTVWKVGSYTSPVIRILPLMASFALTACATTASNAELDELRSELRAMRQENARLEKRLDRVELHATVAPLRGPASAPASAPAAVPENSAALPALTVVKMKPRQQAAPKLATQTSIVEPSPEVLEALKTSVEADPPSDTDLDADVGDAFYEQGVSALKTGNVAGGILELQKFAAESPRHPHADNALYFIGLGLMGLKDFEGAAKSFEDVVQKYPAGDAVLESMLKLGECRVRLNKPADARVVYQKIVASYPGTTAATAARARLSSLTGSP